MPANPMMNGLAHGVKIIASRIPYPVYYETEEYGLTHVIAINRWPFGESEKVAIKLQKWGEILKVAEIKEIEYHGEM